MRVDPELPFEIAALFGCAVLTGAGAVIRSAAVAAGDRVAVFGLGGVGLAALLGAVVAGAATIVAVDVVPEKLDLARELGATHAVAAGPDAVAAVREVTGGGADKAVETVGNERVLAEAYAATRRGGTTVTVGLPHPSRMLSIPAVSLVAEERTLRGSYLGSSRARARHPALHRALRPGAPPRRPAADPPARARRAQRGLRPPGRGARASARRSSSERAPRWDGPVPEGRRRPRR